MLSPVPAAERDLFDMADHTALINPAPATTRISDPETSFDAAASVKPEETRAIYKQLITVLGDHGPLTDEGIAHYVEAGAASPSGLRTRRHELLATGYIEYAGYKKPLATGRKSRCWQLTTKGAAIYRNWSGNEAIRT